MITQKKQGLYHKLARCSLLLFATRTSSKFTIVPIFPSFHRHLRNDRGTNEFPHAPAAGAAATAAAPVEEEQDPGAAPPDWFFVACCSWGSAFTEATWSWSSAASSSKFFSSSSADSSSSGPWSSSSSSSSSPLDPFYELQKYRTRMIWICSTLSLRLSLCDSLLFFFVPGVLG